MHAQLSSVRSISHSTVPSKQLLLKRDSKCKRTLISREFQTAPIRSCRRLTRRLSCHHRVNERTAARVFRCTCADVRGEWQQAAREPSRWTLAWSRSAARWAQSATKQCRDATTAAVWLHRRRRRCMRPHEAAATSLGPPRHCSACAQVRPSSGPARTLLRQQIALHPDRAVLCNSE